MKRLLLVSDEDLHLSVTISAGADIKEMLPKTFMDVYWVFHLVCVTHAQGNFLNHWTRVAQARKPVIAAVNGFAVGFCRSYDFLSSHHTSCIFTTPSLVVAASLQ